MKHVVIMGGGTGSFVVLSGLRASSCAISAIVTMSDSGGSSGLLRDELGVLPPGDIRQCLVALSGAHKPLRELFAYRFKNGGLKGHNIGNLFLAALQDLTGSFEKAVETAGEVLQIKGRVLPVTLESVELCARLRNGNVLEGENTITHSTLLQRVGIEKLYLSPPAKANPKAIEVIKEADLFVLAPGNLYSSLIPNLLVKDIPEAIVKSDARKVYVCNLVTRRGQTQGFRVHQFVEELERWAGRPLFDTVVYNSQRPSESLLKRYKKQGDIVVFEKPQHMRKKLEFYGVPLLSKRIPVPEKADALAGQRSFIRHDPKKLASVLLALLNRNYALPLG